MRSIGALIFPGFELLDLFGPLEFFGMLPDRYELTLIAQEEGAIKSGQGPSVIAEVALEARNTYDILFVPGGPGTRRDVTNTLLLDWITDTAEKSEYVLSVCTGSALLARAGLLDGRNATTNKAAFYWVEAQGPRVKWQKKARWVEDGTVFTSSGVSAGMDMALAAIAHMHGDNTAREVAVRAEYEWHENPDRDLFASLHGLE